jgi:hypothetical protein
MKCTCTYNGEDNVVAERIKKQEETKEEKK